MTNCNTRVCTCRKFGVAYVSCFISDASKLTFYTETEYHSSMSSIFHREISKFGRDPKPGDGLLHAYHALSLQIA